MKTILVTGGNGQLGKCIKDGFQLKENLKVIYTNSSTLDITNKVQIDAIFESNSIDYCINCAAYTAVDKAENDSKLAYKINAEGAKNLAKKCKENGAILIHISTDFVFDGERVCSYEERDTTNPINVYGASKLKGEELIKQNLEDYFILRTSWLYSEYGANFLKTMLRLGIEREELSVVSDQIGSPTYAKDLASVILKLIESETKKYGVYHYSNRGKTSWCGFAQAIFEEADIHIKLDPIKTEAYPTPAKRPKFSVLCTAKISEELGGEIPYWKDSLKVAIQNLKKG